jgi:DNA-binding response OmpR family regulator
MLPVNGPVVLRRVETRMEPPVDAADDPFRPSVLIVEDDWEARDEHDLMLSRVGLWVYQAPNPETAFVLAMERIPDVVVTDIDPVSSVVAESLVDRLNAHPRTAEIPIIGLTRESSNLFDSRYRFAAVLTKPVSQSALIDGVRVAIQRSQALRIRSNCARARIPDLLSRSAKAIDASSRLLSRHSGLDRRCPVCSHWMLHAETQTIDGIVYDYFTPCQTQCGHFRYDRERHLLLPLS